VPPTRLKEQHDAKDDQRAAEQDHDSSSPIAQTRLMLTLERCKSLAVNVRGEPATLARSAIGNGVPDGALSEHYACSTGKVPHPPSFRGPRGASGHPHRSAGQNAFDMIDAQPAPVIEALIE
jgi:hypothetical protein